MGYGRQGSHYTAEVRRACQEGCKCKSRSSAPSCEGRLTVQELRRKVLESKGKGKAREGGRYRDLPDEEDRIGDDPAEAARWEQEEQQVGSLSNP